MRTEPVDRFAVKLSKDSTGAKRISLLEYFYN
jgi:hypothetical protein